MYEEVVGVIGISPSDFFNLEPVECFPIITGYKNRMKINNESNFISYLNALGTTLSKKYKYIDPFKEQEVIKITEADRDELFKELENL